MQQTSMNMRAFIFGSIGILMLSLTSCGSSDSSSDDGLGNWVKSSDYEGNKRANAVSFVIGERAFVGCGYNGTEDEYYSDFYVYDYSLKYWSKSVSLPGAARTDAVGFSIENRGYVGLGYDGDDYLADFYAYDQSTNAWVEIAPFPGDARRASVGFSVDGKGYVGTGYDGGRDFQDFWQYDPSADAWTQIPSLGARRRDAVIFTVDDLVYLVSGSDNGSLKVDFYEFDYKKLPDYPWKELTDIDDDDDYDIARVSAVGFSVDGFGYVCFGINGSMTRTVYQYNPSTDTWLEKNNLEDLVPSRRDAIAFVINNEPFITTGSNGGSYYYDTWRFEPSKEEDEDD